ncbi:hypothetical protein Trydic_g7325 [Trypoxylus dichotomus]
MNQSASKTKVSSYERYGRATVFFAPQCVVSTRPSSDPIAIPMSIGRATQQLLIPGIFRLSFIYTPGTLSVGALPLRK